jgi:hypothetical protein
MNKTIENGFTLTGRNKIVEYNLNQAIISCNLFHKTMLLY